MIKFLYQKRLFSTRFAQYIKERLFQARETVDIQLVGEKYTVANKRSNMKQQKDKRNYVQRIYDKLDGNF